jgi:hypothetical protein
MAPRPNLPPHPHCAPSPTAAAASALLIASIGCASTTGARVSSVVRADPRYEAKTVVRPSRIPHGGNGLFALEKFKSGETIGVYGGRLVTDEDCPKDESYVVILDDCALEKAKPYKYLDGKGSDAHVTRANFAPFAINGKETHLQNARLDTICDYPYVVYIATRDIEPGEEIWTSYGDEYDYDRFMGDKEIQRFFCDLAKLDCSSGFSFAF